MVIVCPYCTHKLNLKAAKPGRFRPNCPGCQKPFLLYIPENPAEEAQARPVLEDTLVTPAKSGLIPGATDAAQAARAAKPKSGVIPGEATHAAQAAKPPAPPKSGLILGLEDTMIPVPAPEMELAREPAPAPSATPQPRVHQTGAAPADHLPDSIPIAAAPSAPREPGLKPKTVVRGYELERELGRGGMGSVYLARQLSLDRHVALKVMSNRWASDPVFVARFTREAYASAQLSHPNIVQIHDIGEVGGTRFFSMEYVRGKSLADVVKTQGKLDPETAVGYVLQAARGLKHAHDRGMIHRDVKPDNLLLGEQGIVKVADLGLVKTPTTERADDQLAKGPKSGLLLNEPKDMTGVRIALGTPAYMSPEQCRDAAMVDHRADIYSLGCTLYVLVTGRPPFDGNTAMELMSKHAYDPLVPPEQIVSRVPKEVSAVIQKMMAKNAEDRFQTMDDVIRTLETWLGVSHAGSFSPREEQITQLEGFVTQFNNAPAAVLRGRVLKGFFAAIAIGAVLLTFFGRAHWAFGLVGLAVQASLAYFVIDGIANRSFLFTRTRQFMFGLSWGDWGVGLASLALFCVMLAMLDQFWHWVGFGVMGLGLAFGLRYWLDRKVEQQRKPQIEGCERLLRRLRMQGLDEDQIGQFVAKYAGRDWEEFFEALFGYEAKLNERAVLLRGGAAGVREKHGSWREPIIAMMDRIEKARKAAREQRLLLAVERANLLAAGAAPEEADNKAKATADAMVQAAEQVREVEEQRVRVANDWAGSDAGSAAAVAAASAPAPVAPPAPVNIRLAVAAAEKNALAAPAPRKDVVGPILRLFVGPHVRAIGGLLLLVGCAMWMDQNGLIPGSKESQKAIATRDLGDIQDATAAKLHHTEPLAIKGVPASLTSWIDSWNSGVAGLLLLASLFYRGNVMSIFALLGAGIVAVGHHVGIGTVEVLSAEHVAMLLGSVIAFVGFRLGR